MGQANYYWTLPHIRQTLGMTDNHKLEKNNIDYFLISDHKIVSTFNDQKEPWPHCQHS
jgi:hypothetical protein